MSTKLRIAYLAHSVRSDWNNGNAHFLRGLLRAMVSLGHTVRILEPKQNWSMNNLADEPNGPRSLETFSTLYPDLKVQIYSESADHDTWTDLLQQTDIVILHEWNPPKLAQTLLHLRAQLGFKLLFHDTHHRATSSPEAIRSFGIDHFDGVLAFGNVLRDLYRSAFGLENVWTLHEAADTTLFKPQPSSTTEQDVVWIGNWGDEERSSELREFLLTPAAARRDLRFTIFGVRYPPNGLDALQQAGIRYGGYLPNLDAPATYARSRLTIHVPRRQYATTMVGIPTIRVFEALACGIPLLSAPWQDTEHLFRPGDLTFVQTGNAMSSAMDRLLADPSRAQAQAAQGLETILARHTCNHRATELTEICKEVLQ